MAQAIQIGFVDSAQNKPSVVAFLQDSHDVVLHDLTQSYGEDSLEAEDLQIVLLIQKRRRVFTSQDIQRLRRRFPWAVLISVDSRWNEGHRRSGKPYAGVIHMRETEFRIRIERIIRILGSNPSLLGQYRPLSSPRERLHWWLSLGMADRKFVNAKKISCFGQRESISAIGDALQDKQRTVAYRPLSALKRIPIEDSTEFRVVVVRCRAEVKQLLVSGWLVKAHLLVADNLTESEIGMIRRTANCQVLEKPFYNSDLLGGMGAILHHGLQRAA